MLKVALNTINLNHDSVLTFIGYAHSQMIGKTNNLKYLWYYGTIYFSQIRKSPHTFNCSFRYIDDDLSLNNSRFGDYLHRIYSNELEEKVTTDIQKPVSYIDLHLEIDNGGRLKTKHYDKCDDFPFPKVNFPFVSSNITSSPAYGVFISQLVRLQTGR